jgi:hypothetical protein
MAEYGITTQNHRKISIEFLPYRQIVGRKTVGGGCTGKGLANPAQPWVVA